MTAFHPRLNCARTTSIKCNGSMLGMWNKQVEDTIVKQYGSVSLHARVVETIAQFCARIENMMYGITVEVIN